MTSKSRTTKEWWDSMGPSEREAFLARRAALSAQTRRVARVPSNTSSHDDMQLYELCCAEWASAGHPIKRSD